MLSVAGDPVAPGSQAEPAPSMTAEAMIGLWMSEHGDGKIRVSACEDIPGWCGTIVWVRDANDESGQPRRDVKNPDPALRDRFVNGLQILRFAGEPDGSGTYGECRIYDPKRGDDYRCRVRLESPDLLRIRGYLGITLIGKTTRWRRIIENDGSAD